MVTDLADREAGLMPEHAEFPSTADYLRAWHLWRAIRRDAELTTAERDVRFWTWAQCAGLGHELAKQMTNPLA